MNSYFMKGGSHLQAWRLTLSRQKEISFCPFTVDHLLLVPAASTLLHSPKWQKSLET